MFFDPLRPRKDKPAECQKDEDSGNKGGVFIIIQGDGCPLHKDSEPCYWDIKEQVLISLPLH